MAFYDERDATLRHAIITEIIRARAELQPNEWADAATKVYEFVTQTTYNTPARKPVTDDIPF